MPELAGLANIVPAIEEAWVALAWGFWPGVSVPKLGAGFGAVGATGAGIWMLGALNDITQPLMRQGDCTQIRQECQDDADRQR